MCTYVKDDPEMIITAFLCVETKKKKKLEKQPFWCSYVDASEVLHVAYLRIHCNTDADNVWRGIMDSYTTKVKDEKIHPAR